MLWMSKIKSWFRKYVLRKRVSIYIRWEPKVVEYSDCYRYYFFHIFGVGKIVGGFLFSIYPKSTPINSIIIMNHQRMKKYI